MPDTPSNQVAWLQSRSQKEGCGFPIMRVVGLFDLVKGVWVVMRKITNRKPDPRAKRLGSGDLLERWKKPPIRLK